jgi:Thioredoxin like C-terminal domain
VVSNVPAQSAFELLAGLYFVDAGSLIRHHFGEGEYGSSEIVLQPLLAEAGFAGAGRELVSVDAHGVEAPADWATVLLDGRSPGTAYGLDIDDQGNGAVTRQRLYQLIRQPGRITDRTVAITFLDPAVRAYVFTFSQSFDRRPRISIGLGQHEENACARK